MKKLTNLCVTIQADTVLEFQQKIKKAETTADLIEIWLEKTTVDFADIRKMTKKPLLAKGNNARSLIDALHKGADLIDVPLKNSSALTKKLNEIRGRKKTTLIISYHNFKDTPSLPKLWALFQKARASGANIVKIATTAKTVDDNLTIFNLLLKTRQTTTPCIAVCMGEQGQISRLLGSVFGSYLSYVALDQESITAKGMLTLEEWQSKR